MCNTISHTPPPETGTSPNFGEELYGRDIKNKCNINTLHLLVGATGFEPATTWSQTRCATGLRYAPNTATKLVNFLVLTKSAAGLYLSSYISCSVP